MDSSDSESSVEVSSADSIAAKDAPVVWTDENQIKLLRAILPTYNSSRMETLKPLGTNGHFRMICIVERLRREEDLMVTNKDVWNYLDTLYDMEVLDDTEFENEEDMETSDFMLPEDEFIDFVPEKDRKDFLAQQPKKQKVIAPLPVAPPALSFTASGRARRSQQPKIGASADDSKATVAVQKSLFKARSKSCFHS